MCIPDSVKVMTSVEKPSASLFATLYLFLCAGGMCFELALIYSSVLGCPKFGESEEVAKKFLVVWETKLYLKLICASLNSLLEKSTTGCRPDQNLASFHRPALHLNEDTGGGRWPSDVFLMTEWVKTQKPGSFAGEALPLICPPTHPSFPGVLGFEFSFWHVLGKFLASEPDNWLLAAVWMALVYLSIYILCMRVSWFLFSIYCWSLCKNVIASSACMCCHDQ